MTNEVNLCGDCNREIPSCPEVKPIFGGGLGDDNVVECNTYDSDRFPERIKSLRELVKVQRSTGNYDYDPYMHGMANGMILSEHVVSGAEGGPAYAEAPKRWLRKSSFIAVGQSVDALKDAMQSDPEFAYSWHANIAMSMFDGLPPAEGEQYGLNLTYANEGASRFMKTCFDVETSEDRLHWYSLSFRGPTRFGGAFTGVAEKKITIRDIARARSEAGVGDNVTLVSVSYLGHMTKKEFTGEE